KAVQTKRPVILEPMNPYDRRIVHSALQDSRTVKTHSEGKEPFRRVVITPLSSNKTYNK
ncbi:R3H domain-containing nucleic acid-binding protein, partial [Zhenhengia sp.]